MISTLQCVLDPHVVPQWGSVPAASPHYDTAPAGTKRGAGWHRPRRICRHRPTGRRDRDKDCWRPVRGGVAWLAEPGGLLGYGRCRGSGVGGLAEAGRGLAWHRRRGVGGLTERHGLVGA